MAFDAGSIKGSIDLDAGQFNRNLAGAVGAAGTASGQIEASFSEVKAVLSESVAPALAQVAAAATAAAATATPAVQQISTAAAAVAPAVQRAAAGVTAGAAQMAVAVGRVTEAFPRVDAAADRAGRAIDAAIAPAVARAATAATGRLDTAAVHVERVMSGTLSPALDRIAAKAGTALGSLAPAVDRVASAAGTASASLAKVGDLAGQVSEHVSILFGQARAAAAPLVGVIGSVGESLTGLRISAVGMADQAAAAFSAAAEPLVRSLTPALEQVARVAGPPFERVQAGAGAAGAAATSAAVRFDQMAAEAGQGLQRASAAAESAAGSIDGSLVPALGMVAGAAAGAVAELAKIGAAAGLAAATAAAGGLYESVKRAGGEFHEMGLAAERAGVSVEWMSRLAAVASTAGVDLGTLSNGFRLLEQRASQAAAGDEAGIKAFARLGISAQQAGAMMADPQRMFEQVRESLAKLSTQADRVAAAKGLLGGMGGNELIPLLTMDPARLEAIADGMQRLGGTVSEQDAEMGRALGELEGYFRSAMLGIERAVSKPVLTYLEDHIQEIEPRIEAATGRLTELFGRAWDGIIAGVRYVTPAFNEVVAGARNVASAVATAFGPLARELESLASRALAFGRVELDKALAVIGPAASAAAVGLQVAAGWVADLTQQALAYGKVGLSVLLAEIKPATDAAAVGLQAVTAAIGPVVDQATQCARAGLTATLDAIAPAANAAAAGFDVVSNAIENATVKAAAYAKVGLATVVSNAPGVLAGVASAVGATSVATKIVNAGDAAKVYLGLDTLAVGSAPPAKPAASPPSPAGPAPRPPAGAAAPAAATDGPAAVRPPAPRTVAENLAGLKAAKPPKPPKAGRRQPAFVPTSSAPVDPPFPTTALPVLDFAPAVAPALAAVSAAAAQVGRLGSSAETAAGKIDGFANAMERAMRPTNELIADVAYRTRLSQGTQATAYPNIDAAGRQIDGRSGGPTTNNVVANMTVTFDPKETADAVARRIVPMLRNAADQQRQRMEGAAMVRAVAASMGGLA